MGARSQLQQAHRYYTTTHQMRVVEPILTGAYLQTGDREQPPAEITAAMDTPVPPALATATQRELELDRA